MSSVMSVYEVRSLNVQWLPRVRSIAVDVGARDLIERYRSKVINFRHHHPRAAAEFSLNILAHRY